VTDSDWNFEDSRFSGLDLRDGAPFELLFPRKREDEVPVRPFALACFYDRLWQEKWARDQGRAYQSTSTRSGEPVWYAEPDAPGEPARMKTASGMAYAHFEPDATIYRPPEAFDVKAQRYLPGLGLPVTFAPPGPEPEDALPPLPWVARVRARPAAARFGLGLAAVAVLGLAGAGRWRVAGIALGWVLLWPMVNALPDLQAPGPDASSSGAGLFVAAVALALAGLPSRGRGAWRYVVAGLGLLVLLLRAWSQWAQASPDLWDWSGWYWLWADALSSWRGWAALKNGLVYVAFVAAAALVVFARRAPADA
jgi:hypothetical protein